MKEIKFSFSASILRADMKHGKKHFSVDENKRYTYKQVHPSASGNESSLFSNTNGDVKQLSAVCNLWPLSLSLFHLPPQ